MKLKANVLLIETRRGVEPISLDLCLNVQLFDELIPCFANSAAVDCAGPVQLEDDLLQDDRWQRQPVRDERGLLIITVGCDFTRHGSTLHWAKLNYEQKVLQFCLVS